MTTAEIHDFDCICCKHFDLDWGEPDYSEDTPGSDPSACCKKGHFGWTSEFGKELKRAKLCPDFVHR